MTIWTKGLNGPRPSGQWSILPLVHIVRDGLYIFTIDCRNESFWLYHMPKIRINDSHTFVQMTYHRKLNHKLIIKRGIHFERMQLGCNFDNPNYVNTRSHRPYFNNETLSAHFINIETTSDMCIFSLEILTCRITFDQFSQILNIPTSFASHKEENLWFPS